MKNPILFLLPVLLFACGKKEEKKQQAPPAVAVRVAEVVERPVIFYDKYPSTIAPLNQVQVRPQTAGFITAVHFKEGDVVRKGQKLYTMDQRTYQATANQARASIATAEANRELARKDVERYRRLDEAEAIAKQTLQQAEALLDVREQEVRAAEEALRSANTQLDYAVLRAPLSGVTALNSAKLGTQVSPGAPVLTTISQEAPVGVDFPLPQRDIPRVARLENQPVAALDSTFRLRLPDGSLYPSFGRIYALDQSVDPRTGNLTVRLEFPNADGVLRTGMSVVLEMLNDQSGRQLVIPSKALNEQMGEYYVFEQLDSIVRRRQVKVGKNLGGEVVLLEGVAAGERVVTEGIKNLRDSTKVAVQPPPSSTASQNR